MGVMPGAIALGAGLLLALALSLAPGRRLQALVVASQTGRAATARLLAGYGISEVVYAAGLASGASGGSRKVETLSASRSESSGSTRPRSARSE